MGAAVTVDTPEDAVQERNLIGPGVGSAFTVAALGSTLLSGGLGSGAWAAIGRNGWSSVLKGFGAGNVVGSLGASAVKLAVGAATGDRTIAGFAVSAMTGEAVAYSTMAVGMKLLRVPLLSPAGWMVAGAAIVVGSTGGRILRDVSPEFRHFTDDIISHDLIIANTPEMVKEPIMKAYDKTWSAVENVIASIKNWVDKSEEETGTLHPESTPDSRSKKEAAIRLQ